MKFAKKIFVVAAMVLSFASLGFAADDVSVGVENTNTNNADATGGNATQTQDQNQLQGQKQGQQSEANSSNVIRAPLPEVGFSPFPVPGKAMIGGGWEVYSPCIYRTISVEKLKGMKSTSWWGGTSIKVFGKVTASSENVSLVQYWPKSTFVPGDAVLASGTHSGKAEKSEEEFVAEISYDCYKKTGSTRVAVLKKTTIEGVTSAATLSLSGMGAATSGSGQEGAVFAVGGGFGKNRTSAEEHNKFQFVCMNDGPLVAYGTQDICEISKKKEVSQVIIVKPAPTPEQKIEPKKEACNPEPIRRRIESLKVEISKCKFWGSNNEYLRLLLADAYIDLAKCTGEKGYFSDAIENYKLAEENYQKGKDIKANKAFADQILYRVYWNWSAVIRELYGRDAEVRFAQKHHLTTMPSSIDELKR